MKSFIMAMLFALSAVSLSAAVQTGSVESRYPTLTAQLDSMKQSFQPQINFTTAVNNLDDYLSSTNRDFPADMAIVLQPGYYNNCVASRTSPIVIDGEASDWRQMAFRASDPTGDSFGGTGSDVVEIAFTMDESDNAVVMIRTAGRPLKNQSFYILFDYDRDWNYETEAVFFWWTDGKLYMRSLDLLHDNATKDIVAEVSIGSVFEARFAMSDMPHALPAQPLRVYGGIAQFDTGKYDGAGQIDYDVRPVNYALEILLWLAQNKCYEKNDPITMALALANNYIYSIADDETRKAILTDVMKHYKFYRSIVAGQETAGVNYPLRTAPLVPKIFWADRSGDKFWLIQQDMTRFHTKKLTLAIYRDFVDKIEVLESIRKAALSEGLALPSLARTASTTEEWVHSHRTYRSSIENLVDFNRRGVFSDEELAASRDEIRRGLYTLNYNGTNRRWDEFRWINYQWNLYQTTGRFRGDCGDTTIVQMAFYRAIGVCPVSLQYIGATGAAADMHNFPGYFNPLQGRWFTYQKPVFYGNGGARRAGIDLYLYFTKPVYHHWVYKNDWRQDSSGIHYAYYQGEKTTSDRLVNYLTLGMDSAQFDRIFLTNLTQTPGLFFNDTTAPRVIADADRDGVADVIESRYRTSLTSPDTDGDGYSDRWEVDWGYDPLRRNDPAATTLPVIDGLAANELAAPGWSLTVTDPRGDSKATSESRNDLESFTVRRFGGNLYFATSFYNDFRQTSMRDHSFFVTFKDGERNALSIHFYGSYLSLWTVHTNQWTRWNYNGAGIDSATIANGEFLIPIAPLTAAGAPSVVYIRPRICGYAAPTNAYLNDADTARSVRISFDPDDIANRLDGLFAGARVVNDPAGDSDAVKELFDISKAAIQTDRDYLYVRAAYHNRIDDNPFGFHAVWVSDPATKKNWWVQWWDTAYLSVWFWKDGETSKQIDVDYTPYDCIPVDGGYVFVVPLSLFGTPSEISVRYCVSGMEADGSMNYNADSTEPASIRLR